MTDKLTLADRARIYILAQEKKERVELVDLLRECFSDARVTDKGAEFFDRSTLDWQDCL